TERTPDACPYENGFATPSIGVDACDESERRVGHELGGADDTDLERCRTEYSDYENGHRSRGRRRTERTDRRGRPEAAKRRARGRSEITHQIPPLTRSAPTVDEGRRPIECHRARNRLRPAAACHRHCRRRSRPTV